MVTNWKSSFSGILRIITHLFSIKPSDIAEGFCDVTTVRKWINGSRIPNAAGQQHLIEYLEKTIKEKDSQEIYSLVCEQIETCLSNTGLASVRELEKRCRNNTAALVGCVLRLCFANIGKKNSNPSEHILNTDEASSKKTKAVVFDFDGTLTMDKLNRTTWEDIWVSLGYDVDCCRHYHKEFNEGKIDHTTWCQITEDYFKKRKLHRQVLDTIAKRIKLLPGVEEVLKYLYDNDIKIYIVSGSILHVIKTVLKQNYMYIDGIKANQFFFNTQGFLEKIIGTRYDFEGKSIFIQELATELHISTSNVVFIGNSLNDEYAHISGAVTLCINPKYTDSTNRAIWHHCIDSCSNLKEILPFINI